MLLILPEISTILCSVCQYYSKLATKITYAIKLQQWKRVIADIQVTATSCNKFSKFQQHMSTTYTNAQVGFGPPTDHVCIINGNIELSWSEQDSEASTFRYRIKAQKQCSAQCDKNQSSWISSVKINTAHNNELQWTVASTSQFTLCTPFIQRCLPK